MPDRFKVGSFNLYNLALAEEPFYDRSYTKEIYQKKRTWLAQQLQRMDADIVGFQEIFHTEALKDILKASGQYGNASMIVGKRRGSVPVVGLVSRFPVVKHGFVSTFPNQAQLEIEGTEVPIHRFSRPVLWATLEMYPGMNLTVFVVHLKSKNPKISPGADPHDPLERALGKAKSLIIRAAEATALRSILLDQLYASNHPIIVMGDINDTETAVTSEIASGSPPWRKLSLEAKKQSWDVLLYNGKDIQARQSYRDIYYTHIHNGHYESLDHILVSQEFVRENRQSIGYIEYVTVFNDHLRDETLSDDAIPPWQSDHGQVVTTIRLNDE